MKGNKRVRPTLENIGRMRQSKKKKKGFTRKLLLEICISFLKESWAAGTQRRRRGGERAESLALDTDYQINPPGATSSGSVTQRVTVRARMDHIYS